MRRHYICAYFRHNQNSDTDVKTVSVTQMAPAFLNDCLNLSIKMLPDSPLDPLFGTRPMLPVKVCHAFGIDHWPREVSRCEREPRPDFDPEPTPVRIPDRDIDTMKPNSHCR
jgi:hypothetical protein